MKAPPLQSDERELELAKLAHHLRGASRAAKRLGIEQLRPKGGSALALLAELMRAAAGVDSVPDIEVRALSFGPKRVHVLDLYAQLRDELLS